MEDRGGGRRTSRAARGENAVELSAVLQNVLKTEVQDVLREPYPAASSS
jgi:hypothetical protein